MEHIILLGASGHSKVIIDILHSISRKEKKEYSIALLDDDETLYHTDIMGHRVIGKIDDCVRHPDSKFIIAIGNNRIRRKIAQEYPLDYMAAVHPSAVIGENVQIGTGTVIMPGTIVNSGTQIGGHCIINTSSTVDHDGRIGDYVHLSPGVHLGGAVSIGQGTWMGVGSCCVNNVAIAPEIVVGAGGVVVKDLREPGTYVGIPAKKMGDRKLRP